jgi:toxin ParE1/3/4
VSYDFVLTPDAADDLVAIWEYLADEDNEATADHVIRRLYAEFQKLSEMPGMGHYREDLLDRRHRFWNVWSYVIAYRWQGRPLPIISVIHGARNLDAFFARPRFKRR